MPDVGGSVPDAPDPDEVARRCTEAMWRNDAASAMLGMRVRSVAPGSAEVSMVVRVDMVNGWSLCHGGLLASLADSAFAVACNSRGRVTVAAGFVPVAATLSTGASSRATLLTV